MSNSSPMPVPIAVIIDWISAFESTLLMRFFSELITLPRSGRIAWKVRSRASTAEPPAELPSTRKSSAEAGSVIWQSASEPARERRALERAFAPGHPARLARRLPGARGLDRLVDDPLRVARVLLEELGEPLVDGLLDEAAHPRVAELRLRLPLELRV